MLGILWDRIANMISKEELSKKRTPQELRSFIDTYLHNAKLMNIDKRLRKKLDEELVPISYFLNHEFGLYIGRLFGCGLFISMTYLITEDFALKYALLIIAILQLISIFVAKNILSTAKKLQS